MTQHPFDEEVTDRFALALLTALAQGPIGEALLEVANGTRRVVVKQHATLSGWVIETEAVLRSSEGEA